MRTDRPFADYIPIGVILVSGATMAATLMRRTLGLGLAVTVALLVVIGLGALIWLLDDVPRDPDEEPDALREF